MGWDKQTKLRNRRKKLRLQLSADTFDEAAELAEDNSCSLEQMPTDYHFQLICFDGSGREQIYNLYPSTQRIYSDPKHRGPFLEVKKPWTLLDVVKAAVGKSDGPNCKTCRNVSFCEWPQPNCIGRDAAQYRVKK